MAYSLKQLASIHIEQWNAGTKSKDSQSKYQIVIPQIRVILGDLFMPLMYERYNEGDRTPPAMYINSFELTLSNSEKGAYVDLSEWFVDLPRDKGIWRVFQKLPDKGYTEFIPTKHRSINLNTRAGRYPTHKKYWIEGRRIYLQNIFAEPGKFNKIEVQIICPAPATVGENDFLPISPTQANLILRKLLELNAPQLLIPQDRLNDDNPNRKATVQQQ